MRKVCHISKNAGYRMDTQRWLFGGKELDRMASLDQYDFEARMYDPATIRFTRMDDMADSYLPTSPLAYCLNNPLSYIDPTGESVYMLFYTTNNKNRDGKPEKNADAMFRQAALTRKKDIEDSKSFNKDKDIVVVRSIEDLAQIKKEVSDIVGQYSAKYGTTAEFGMWSHSGFQGPMGSQDPSQENIGSHQMSLRGWSKVDFNWGQNATASFYGCNSGNVDDKYPVSFTEKVSSLSNFKNVSVYGQTASAYPSISKTRRKYTDAMRLGAFSYPTYMVGNKGRWSSFLARLSSSAALEMKICKNGRVIGNSYQR